ncbi:MAG: acyl carrier protein [Lachnospiraceae bacterium]|nr:acyl carrier protein [Lachnospiraceae bacterium]
MLKKIADRLVEQLGVDESEVTPEASFKDDLAADSIDLFEMVMSLEDEYDIEIPTDRLEEIETVGDLMEVLEELGIEE